MSRDINTKCEMPCLAQQTKTEVSQSASVTYQKKCKPSHCIGVGRARLRGLPITN